MVTRRERIYHYVEDYTRDMVASHNLENNGVNALDISLSLKLDRTNVSRELNSLWKEGKIIKLQGRPTLYLDYATIHTEYPNHYIPLVISSDSSLLDFIEKTEKESHKELPFHQTPLDGIIGVSGSLKEETAKAIAALSYPPHGLPILLMGNAGVGKRKFAESLYYYALESQILPEHAQFIIINCPDYSHSEERFMMQLLGYRKNNALNTKAVKGAIDSANNGIVYFDGLHKLPAKSIDLIIDILKNSCYTRIGDSRPRPLEATFIAATRKNIETELLDNIKNTFPVMISLPDFNNRNSLEKIETILYLFTRESFSTQKNIRLDKSILTAFAMPIYQKNESQLRNEIRSACSKAFLEQNNKGSYFITIGFEHLSDFLLSSTPSSEYSNGHFLDTLAMYKEEVIICESNGHCDALEYFKGLPHSTSSQETNLPEPPDPAGFVPPLSILLVCHGQFTASDMLQYTQKLANDNHIRMEAINYTQDIPLLSLLELISDAVLRLNQGSGVLIWADMEPITGMELSIHKKTQVPCKILPSITLSGLIHSIMQCADGYTLDQFSPSVPVSKQNYKEMSQEEFINHLVNDILSRTLLYVNPKKATDTLLYSLNLILDSLNQEYSQEIAVKYLSHGVHMIERIIRNMPLPYYQLKQFTNTNHQLMDIIAQSLTIVSDTFAISIPSSEIAYLAEIFLQ